MSVIRPTVVSVLRLSAISGYIFISILFLVTKLFVPSLVIVPLSYLSLFIASFLIANLYLYRCKVVLKDEQIIFYKIQIFIKYFEVRVNIKDIDLINANFNKDQFSDLNFILVRANKNRYRIPTRSFKEESVVDFIEKVKMLKVI